MKNLISNALIRLSVYRVNILFKRSCSVEDSNGCIIQKDEAFYGAFYPIKVGSMHCTNKSLSNTHKICKSHRQKHTNKQMRRGTTASKEDDTVKVRWRG